MEIKGTSLWGRVLQVFATLSLLFGISSLSVVTKEVQLSTYYQAQYMTACSSLGKLIMYLLIPNTISYQLLLLTSFRLL